MRRVNIDEAKTDLSKLISNGEEVIILRYGKPVAQLIPLRSPTARRIPGSACGKFVVPAEFFDPMWQLKTDK
ncbi:MAG: type II toxin-antitoxin system Phd/YefM family antitoxin [Deltaproteobacteria bacterium]|jgi:antitoxin (DNA-binding transcriptional repressor) of toxin-antitoxin stability system